MKSSYFIKNFNHNISIFTFVQARDPHNGCTCSCLCYSRKGMELFYEKGEDKNGVLSYGIYRRNRRNCGKKSRFIAEVFPVSNEEEAFAHLEEIRKNTGMPDITAGHM